VRVIVCGAGQVGTSIARQLALEGHSVTIIDQSEALSQRMSDTLDVRAVTGFASHPSVMEQAGMRDADMVIAVTVSDEVNMVICEIANAIFNVPFKIARIRNQHYLEPEYRDLFQRDHIPIDVIISPEIEVAHAIEHRLHVPGAVDLALLGKGKVAVVALRSGAYCPTLGRSVTDINEVIRPHSAAIVGLVRGDHFLIPKPQDRLQSGDELYIAGETLQIKKALSVFGFEENEARRVIIIGGGNIGLLLAQHLEKDSFNRVKVIESDRDRAECVAEALRSSIVLHGSGLDRDVLVESNIAAVETVIAVTNDDRVNIIASLLAKRYGCKRTITLVNDISYIPLINTLGIDVVVSPRETTISSVLQHIRRGKIRSAHTLHNGEAEVMEAEVIVNSPLIGKKVQELSLPVDVALGCIVRGERVFIPDPETEILCHDHLVLLTLASMVKKVEKIFTSQTDYF
jgi:trk system potassium uptake protein TrkA